MPAVVVGARYDDQRAPAGNDLTGRALTSALNAHGYDVAWQRTGTVTFVEGATDGAEWMMLRLSPPGRDEAVTPRQLGAGMPATVLVTLTDDARTAGVVIALGDGVDHQDEPAPVGERLASTMTSRPLSSDIAESRTAGELSLSLASRRVTVGECELTLRPKEFELLARLLAAPGTAVRRETLLAEVWGKRRPGSAKTIDVHVAALRRKLVEVAHFGSVPHIVTLRGYGYRLDPPTE